MNQDEFLQLYQRFLEGKCTPGEIEQLHAWEDELQWEDGEWQLQPAEQQQLREAIKARLQQSMASGPAPVRWFRSGRFWRAAAVVAALCMGAFYLFSKHKATVPAVVQHTKPVDTTNAKKTWLTLGNGRVISLTDATNGKVSGTRASKQQEGLLIYEFAKGPDAQGPPDTNTIRTPNGARFALSLADGSKVWLNAATNLRFPVYFNNDTREVYLTGEAYFEVKADASKPFIVHVNGMAVRAVGTAFNIKSYEEEQQTSATLLEGKVQVKVADHTNMLSPEQQLWHGHQTGRIRVRKVNTSNVLAWKDGWFAFDRESISSIMLEIGRWYNKKIVFIKGDEYRRLSGKVERFNDLKEVLIRLESTGAMQFQTTSNTIMVTIP